MEYLFYQYQGLIALFTIFTGIGFLIGAAIADNWECVGAESPYMFGMKMCKFCGICALVGAILWGMVPSRKEMRKKGYDVFHQPPIVKYYV